MPPMDCRWKSPVISPASRAWRWTKPGFREAMEKHRLASGAGEAFGPLGGEDVEIYRDLMEDLELEGKLPAEGCGLQPL